MKSIASFSFIVVGGRKIYLVDKLDDLRHYMRSNRQVLELRETKLLGWDTIMVPKNLIEYYGRV